MDELIGRLVADVGDDRAAVETGVGIILDFLVKEGPADQMRLLLANCPEPSSGAESRARKRRRHGRIRQFIAYAREKVGEDEVDDIVGASPSLAQFV